MSYNKNFLFLVSDYMSKYTMRDISGKENVKIIYKRALSKNPILNAFFCFYLSSGANKKISLPFKSIIYKQIFKLKFKENKPLCITLSSPWYDKQLIKYFRKHYPDCKLIIRFGDTVKTALSNNPQLSLDIIKDDFDSAIAYNPDDASDYNILFHPVGYSAIPKEELPTLPKSDVAFIGAAKDRLPLIRELYHRFTNAGLKCDFYVTEVPESKRLNDGIVYGDKNLSFPEYIAREAASDCLLEILQKGSTGRTYRMMEAIIYNKKLITNCPEIKDTPYYNKDYVLYFEDEGQITADFVNKDIGVVDYNYQNDFSPVKYLKFLNEI